MTAEELISWTYNNEKEFQSAYVKYLRNSWYWVYKLPDIGYTLKPFDIVALRNGSALAVELKYGNVDTYDKIYKMLRPNQVWWLLHFQQQWWMSVIVWWDKKTKQIYSYIFKYKQYEWHL